MADSSWTLAYLAGHRDMNITRRYVHPQEQTIRAAMASRVGILSDIPRKIWIRGKLLWDRNRLLLRKFLARPERLELPTYWFEASRSIHLSYGRVFTELSKWKYLTNVTDKTLVYYRCAFRSAGATEQASIIAFSDTTNNP